MEIIKFRGLSKENEWVYGIPILPKESFSKFAYMNDEIVIFKNTISQYINNNDKNNKEIYEGDIVKFTDYNDNSYTGIVEYQSDQARFFPVYKGNCKRVFEDEMGTTFFWRELEVIGNIYETTKM